MNGCLVVVAAAAGRQGLEVGGLDAQGIPAPRVMLAHDLRDEGPVGIEAGEITRAAQAKGLIEPRLEVAVPALDRAILVRDTAIVARRLHAVVGAERLVAVAKVLLDVTLEVGESCREAVGPMLLGHPAELPEGILQATGEGREALAAEDDLGMLPAGIDEGEVIDEVIQRRTGDGDNEVTGIEEVGHPLLARGMVLAEDHLALGTMFGPPKPHAALQRPSRRHQLAVGVAPLHLFQHRDRLQAGRAEKKRDDLFVPQARERIRLAAAMTAIAAAHRWQARVLLGTVGRAGAEARHGGCGLLGVFLA